MSNEAEKIDHRKLPRRKRPLSIRDQAILLAYRSQARTQEQLAKDYHLSQSRICQIVRRAARLEAEPAAAGPPSISSPIRNPKSEIPNETALNPTVAAQARAQDIFIRALRAFDRWPAELKTIRHADRDGKTLDEETIRQQTPSSPMLRVALNSHRELCRLEDQAKQQQAAAELSPEERRQQIEAALVELYDAACRAGKVEYHIEPDRWMRDLVKILLGEPHHHWLPVYILAQNIGKELVDLPKPATPDDDDDPSSFPGSGLETAYRDEQQRVRMSSFAYRTGLPSTRRFCGFAVLAGL